jgi:hypothetical protein
MALISESLTAVYTLLVVHRSCTTFLSKFESLIPHMVWYRTTTHIIGLRTGSFLSYDSLHTGFGGGIYTSIR